MIRNNMGTRRTFRCIYVILCVVFLSHPSRVLAEPFTAVGGAIGVGGMFLGGIIYTGYCFVKECCEPKWTVFNVSSLQKGLEASVFGQHIVLDALLNTIPQHVNNVSPERALVLSFHGWTGTGKNHVSDIIAEHLYKKGIRSKYVHKIIGSHDFIDETKIREYRHMLKRKIVNAVTLCERSLFIFDEMEKMPAGIIDVIKPYIDYGGYVDNVDYRKSIFLLIGNVASKDLHVHVHQHFDLGKNRDQLDLKHLHFLLSTFSLDRYGGLEGSSIVQSDLVDWFVPFLPLERRHVKMCAAVELKKRNARVFNYEEVLERIADDYEYIKAGGTSFSRTGCKRIDTITRRHLNL